MSAKNSSVLCSSCKRTKNLLHEFDVLQDRMIFRKIMTRGGGGEQILCFRKIGFFKFMKNVIRMIVD